MWLINTKTLRLEEILDYSTVKYAILSHTWGDDEVSFKDMQDFTRARRQAGFLKIATTCELALEQGLEYAWVDTCCIDKTSSAELSEAINAMFMWYKASAVCFVWLEDLEPTPSASKTTTTGRKLDHISKIASCKWFSRGWTLQELLAPADVRFYDADWNFRFSKEKSVSTLASITKIDVDVLKMTKRLKNVLVGVKMSWAANRQTTRPEDEAYCLLGIFDINMPMIYGEGKKAFQRLQEQIVNQEEDTSILAWLSPFRPPLAAQTFRGVFATSPRQFASSGQISRDALAPRPSIRLENRGVRLGVNGFLKSQSKNVEIPLHLECLACDTPHELFISLLNTTQGFVRVSSETCCRLQDPPKYQTGLGVYCLKVVDPEDGEALECFASKRMQFWSEVEISRPVAAWPIAAWDRHGHYFYGDALSGDFCGLVVIEPEIMEGLRLGLVIYKMANEEINLRFLHTIVPADGHWTIVGGFTEEDLLRYPITLTEIFRKYKATKSSSSYGQKASISFECTCPPEEEDNNAKFEAVANGLEITLSLSTSSSFAGEVEEASDHERNEGAVSRSHRRSSRKRRAALPEPDDERKPRRSERLKMKK